ncbi:MAG: IS66 family insertion sequence element accessory protein TnpA [Sphingobacterium sp.]
MSKQEKRAKMLSMVEDWKAGGLTQKAFSLLHGINIATLGYWVARSKEPKGHRFIPITDSLRKNSEQVEIIYPTGVRLRVESDLALIAQLIRL